MSNEKLAGEEAIQALIAEWRTRATGLTSDYEVMRDDRVKARTLRECADQLDALLAAAPPRIGRGEEQKADDVTRRDGQSASGPTGSSRSQPKGVQRRPETGPMKFGDDWTGVFIRGDNAAGYAMTLRFALSKLSGFEAAALAGVLRLFEGSNERTSHLSDTQVMRPFEEASSHPAIGKSVDGRQSIGSALPDLSSSAPPDTTGGPR